MMNRLLSGLLALSLFLQPLVAQTTDKASANAPSEVPAEIVPIEDLLPADTLAYIATSDLAGLQHSLELLDAYKVARARLPKEDLESGDNPLSLLSSFMSFGIADARALEGTRIGVAIIMPDISGPSGAEREVVLEKNAPSSSRPPFGEPLILLFLEGTRLAEAKQAREHVLTFYNENFEAIGKPSESKTITYKGQRLDRFKDGSVGMWFGATYVLSQQAAIDRLLTLREDRRAERLTDDQEFMQTRAQMMPRTGLFAYVNGKPLQGMMKALTGGLAAGNVPPPALALGTMGVFSSFLGGFNNLKGIGLASTFEREGVVDRLIVNLDPAHKNWLTALFSAPKSEFKATSYVPAGTEILVSQSVDWVNLYDQVFAEFFFGMKASQEILSKVEAEEDARRKESTTNKQPPSERDYEKLQQRLAIEMTPEKIAQARKEQEARFNQELGFVLREELAKDLGNEVTVAWGIPKLVANAASNPVTRKEEQGWAVFIGIKDRAATQQALLKTFSYFWGGGFLPGNSDNDRENAAPKTEAQLQRERELRLQNTQAAWAMMPSEIYKNVEIKTIVAAGLGFSDEYLIVADSKETIKQMLDLSEGGRTMASDYNYSRAMGGMSGAVTKAFVGPQMFDGMLNSFIKSWAINSSAYDSSPGSQVPLNIPATLALVVEGEETNLKLEAFSPLGLIGTIALWGFGDEVKRGTERNENTARVALRLLAKAERTYAKKHQNTYALPATLAKMPTLSYRDADLKEESGNYQFTFKLKPGGKGYEATATPIKYGRRGRKSFFMDESGVLRAADKQGTTATVADEEEQSSAGVLSAVEAAAEAAKEATKEAAAEPAPRPRPVRRKR